MSDLLVIVALVGALILLDILALELGPDSRRFADPSCLPWPGF
jgi:hypothetical protein